MAKNKVTAPRVVKAMAGDVVEIHWHLADGSTHVEAYRVPPKDVIRVRRAARGIEA